jgi:DNA (cytosine-5)-methyltransferase 1
MSPPCQDFSVAKSTGKISNDNDALAQACIDAIKALEPSTVTLENVEGYRKAKGFQAIVDVLWGLGYWVNVDVLNSADFSVPQTRRRLILRAVKGGFPGPLPEPVKPWKGWYQAIEDLIPTLPETQFAAWQLKRLKAASHKGQNIEGDIWIGGANCSESFLQFAIDNRPSIPGIRTKNMPVPTVPADHLTNSKAKAYLVDGTGNDRDATIRGVDEPVPTVISGALRCPSSSPKALLLSKDKGDYSDGHRWQDEPAMTATANDNGRRRAVTPSGRVVRMTPRALARFQTVPDDYALPEKNTLACKVIGNGVPCLMMQRIMEAF